MQFHHRAHRHKPARLGILSGSFNPPTIAHLELVRAAESHVDEVVCVLPRAFPHKEYFGATIEQRIDLLREAGAPAIATTEGGLFVDIAREFHAHYGADTKLYFLCGRDAAERILSWDYGREDAIEEMFREFELLVAPRVGEIERPEDLAHRIHYLSVGGDYGEVSSTEVRERIVQGGEWKHLVPQPIVEKVREIYS